MHAGSSAGRVSTELGTSPDSDCHENLGNVCREYGQPWTRRPIPCEPGPFKYLEDWPEPAIKCDICHRVTHSLSSCSGVLAPWFAGIILDRLADEMLGSRKALRAGGIQSTCLSCIGKAEVNGEAVSRPWRGPITHGALAVKGAWQSGR